MGPPPLSRPLWLNEFERPSFPPTRSALREPNGLLAVGGSLSPSWLLEAYARGIFPWFDENQPILWWSPAPRAVIYPAAVHTARSLRKAVRRNPFEAVVDSDFVGVIQGCAAARKNSTGTWITHDMVEAYIHLFELGYAHSVEVRLDGQLVGGIYGVALGGVFFGESMFSAVPNGSKIALVALCRLWVQMGGRLLDCQMPNDHLMRMGCTEIERETFESLLAEHITKQSIPRFNAAWTHCRGQTLPLYDYFEA